MEKYLDSQGEITRDDFVKVAQDHKLLELNERVTGLGKESIQQILI